MNRCLLGRNDVVAKVTADGSSRFLVIGDWGGLPFLPYDTPSEKAVANAMGKLGERLNTSFQLALGDNFYFDGVKTVADPRFEVCSCFLEGSASFLLFLFSIHLRKYSQPHRYKHRGMFWPEITIIGGMFQRKSNIVKYRNDGR